MSPTKNRKATPIHPKVMLRNAFRRSVVVAPGRMNRRPTSRIATTAMTICREKILRLKDSK